MKSFRTVVAAFAVLLVLGGCAGAEGATGERQAQQVKAGSGNGLTVEYTPEDPIKPASHEDFRIGVSVSVMDSFLTTLVQGIENRAKEAGLELKVVAAEGDNKTQLAQVQDFIEKNYDGIIVIPVDADSTKPVTEAAQKAQVPLVYVNRLPADLPQAIPYVGSDSIVAGQLEMEELAAQVSNSGGVAILVGESTQEAALKRTEGCKEIAAKYGMPVLAEESGEWQRDKAQEIVTRWIKQGLSDLKAVCANNDEMALGAVAALEAAGLAEQVKVGGVDATTDALAALAQGRIGVTVFQDASGQGAGAVDTLVKMTNGIDVPSIVNIPFQLVTKANLSDFQQ